MSSIIPLGKLAAEDAGRDAIHIAVAPVVAAEKERGEAPFQLDCLLNDLRKAVEGYPEKRVADPLTCKVCGGPRLEEAWSGICSDCQDRGHRP